MEMFAVKSTSLFLLLFLLFLFRFWAVSLLGTWAGKGVEVWNSKTSNLLQLFVSIQGLILGTSEPYFLEAGYDKLRGTPAGIASAKLYNESAFLIAMSTIPTILAAPPKEFEKLIRTHWRLTGKSILERCRLLLIDDREHKSATEIIRTPSVGFRKQLHKLLPVLEAALNSLNDK
jgi:ubiquitin-conjugating enzyme E2 O